MAGKTSKGKASKAKASKGSAALTHIDASGEARMVDVSAKAATERTAVAEGHVVMAKATLDLIVSGNAKKGDVLGAARIAGIMAAKRTSELIPLCHPLALSKVTLDITPDEKLPGCIVQASVKVTGPTGVEMQALTAVSVACLTIYDMVKAAERGVRIQGDLARPDGAGPFPAVVGLHGCAGMHDTTKQRLADELVARGYVVLLVDSYAKRLGIDHACTSSAFATYVRRRPDAYGALAFLARQTLVDPQRVAVVGFSA